MEMNSSFPRILILKILKKSWKEGVSSSLTIRALLVQDVKLAEREKGGSSCEETPAVREAEPYTL